VVGRCRLVVQVASGRVQCQANIFHISKDAGQGQAWNLKRVRNVLGHLGQDSLDPQSAFAGEHPFRTRFMYQPLA